MNSFPPLTREAAVARGWLPTEGAETTADHGLDFVLVTGDAYVDHPSFANAVITRVLESKGYRVGVLAQPDWRDAEAFAVFGAPRIAWLVSAGNLDSMLNNYTAHKKPRSDDQYSPDGEGGRRPDYATVVYGQRCRQVAKDVPIIAGGVEVSMRRLAHYDYWSDKIRKSMILDFPRRPGGLWHGGKALVGNHQPAQGRAAHFRLSGNPGCGICGGEEGPPALRERR